MPRDNATLAPKRLGYMAHGNESQAAQKRLNAYCNAMARIFRGRPRVLYRRDFFEPDELGRLRFRAVPQLGTVARQLGEIP